MTTFILDNCFEKESPMFNICSDWFNNLSLIQICVVVTKATTSATEMYPLLNKIKNF